MKLMNDSSPKASLLVDKNEALSTFRRLKKILIFSFSLFFVCLTVAIAALIIYLVRSEDPMSEDQPTLLSPALQAFCFVASNTSSCIKIFRPIIGAKYVSDPNQIFTLSLQKAVKELENVIPLLPPNTVPIRDGKETVATFKNCSTSLHGALSQIRDTLGKMRANPFVEAQSDEQRADMMYWITVAEENLESCINHLATAEATDGNEVRATVLGVKAYVSGGRDFLLRFADVLQMFWIDNGSADWGIINLENLFGVCVGGLELFFVFFMFYTLCTTR